MVDYSETVKACDNCRDYVGCDRYKRMFWAYTTAGIFDILPDRIAENCDLFSELRRDIYRRAS